MSKSEARQLLKIVVSPVEHYAGARHTRTTWTADVLMSDGSHVGCGHERHPTTAAAVKCGKALWKRTARQESASGRCWGCSDRIARGGERSEIIPRPADQED